MDEKNITSIEFLKWAFKQKYVNERELLFAMLKNTEDWYNEITNPLKELLFDSYGFSKISISDPSKYIEIAKELYFRKIESNHGNELSNIIAQMNENGIPLFQSRYKLIQKTQEFLDSGRFIKDFLLLPREWSSVNEFYQREYIENVRKGWNNFKTCKEKLVSEINRQIRRLDAPLNKSVATFSKTQAVFKIVFISADPTNASHLFLDREFREICEQLDLAKKREFFEMALPQLSLRAKDISRTILNEQPYIVHFSGHGTSEGALCFENETGQVHFVQPDAMAALFQQFTECVNCVVLNACYSEIRAKAIGEYIPFVIGMNKAIGDEAAIAFSVGFYQALGAGRSIIDAYNLGCTQIRLQGISEYKTPVLMRKEQN